MVKCSVPGWPARILQKETVQDRVTTCINGCIGGEVNGQRWVMNMKWLFMPYALMYKLNMARCACECVGVTAGVNSSRIKKELLCT